MSLMLICGVVVYSRMFLFYSFLIGIYILFRKLFDIRIFYPMNLFFRRMFGSIVLYVFQDKILNLLMLVVLVWYVLVLGLWWVLVLIGVLLLILIFECIYL